MRKQKQKKFRPMFAILAIVFFVSIFVSFVAQNMYLTGFMVAGFGVCYLLAGK